MNASTPHHLRYQGYCSTSPLWTQEDLTPYPQIQLPEEPVTSFPPEIPGKHRLRKLVETFVYHELKSLPAVQWIADGLQIQEGKRTVGELDALYYHDRGPIHLEVAYKFYLYGTLAEDPDPLARWIGPNRKDNLSLKLDKLRNRHPPLPQHPAAAAYLKKLGLSAEQVVQRVCLPG